MADSIKIDVKQMIKFAKNIGDTSTLKRIYNNAFQNMLDELSSLSKKNHDFTSRTKWLENNVATELQDKLGFVFVDSDVVPYAKFVYDGTNPHIIKAKNKQVLSNGENFFGKSVLHPGYKGDPFILKNWQQHAKKLIDGFLADFVKEYKLSLKVA
jgi:hypothetical protein